MGDSTGPLLTADPSPETILIAMNRFNLVPVIGSGQVRPASTYGKYYEDPLGLRPHLIPLFTQPPGQDVLDLCASEGPQAFPVLLELPQGAVSAAEREAGATSRPIPISGGLRLHCRNAAEARELTAHTWQNADLSTLDVTVSPAAFQGVTPTLDDLKARLAQLPDADEALPRRLAAAARLTGGLLAVAAQGPAEHQLVTSLLQGRQADADAEQSGHPGFRLIQQTLRGQTPVTSEERLLWVMTRVLARLEPGGRISSEQLLRRYRTQLEEAFPDEVTGLKTIDRAERILVHPDVRPGEDRGRPVSFALLIHILRQQLTELVPDRSDWAAFFEAGRPSPGTLTIARFLTGMRISRERLDTADRPADLNGWSAILESEAAVDPGHWLLTVLGKPVAHRDVEAALPEEAGAAVPAAAAGHLDAEAPEGTEDTAGAPALEAPEETAEELSEQQVSSPAVPAPAAVPALGDVPLPDVSVCLLRGWTDLVATQVQLTGPVQMQLRPGRGASSTLLLPGDVQITRVVGNPEEYARRLAALPLTEAEQELLRAAPEAAPAPRKRARTGGTSTKGSRKRAQAPMTPPGDADPTG